MFHRYHEVGETRIREDLHGSRAKACGLEQGYDANTLYTFCVAQPQPVEHPVYSEYKDRVLIDLTLGLGGGWSAGTHHGWSMSSAVRDSIFNTFTMERRYAWANRE